MIFDAPKNSGDTLRDHLINLTSIFPCLDLPADQNVTINFQPVNWVTTSMVATLAAIKSRRADVDFKAYVDSPVWNYLGIVNFPQGLLNLAEIDSYNSSYIPLTRIRGGLDVIEADMMESKFQDMLLKRCHIHQHALDAFYMPISELAVNCREHSSSDSFMFAQHFHKKGYLDISIVDAGIGLSESFKRVDLNYSHDDAMRASLSGESSKGFQGERGFGLPSSQKAVLALGGELLLISGNCAAIVTAERTELIDLGDKAWKGLIVTIRIPDKIEHGIDLASFV